VKHSQTEFLQEMKLWVSRCTSEYEAESMTWKHPYSSAKKSKKGQPPGKVMTVDTLVLWSSVG